MVRAISKSLHFKSVCFCILIQGNKRFIFEVVSEEGIITELLASSVADNKDAASVYLTIEIYKENVKCCLYVLIPQV